MSRGQGVLRRGGGRLLPGRLISGTQLPVDRIQDGPQIDPVTSRSGVPVRHGRRRSATVAAAEKERNGTEAVMNGLDRALPEQRGRQWQTTQ